MSEGPPSLAAIVITAPSSPDSPEIGQQQLANAHRRPPLEGFQSTQSDIASHAPFHPQPLSHPLNSLSPSMSPFQDTLANTKLPPPGPGLFDARRIIWRTATQHPPSQSEENPSRRRLEALLSQPGAIEDDGVWETGVDGVWRGLIAGARLKYRLPLALVVKILQAGWIREGTWPKGAVAPDSGDTPDDTPGPETREQASVFSSETGGITVSGSVEESLEDVTLPTPQ